MMSNEIRDLRISLQQLGLILKNFIQKWFHLK